MAKSILQIENELATVNRWLYKVLNRYFTRRRDSKWNGTVSVMSDPNHWGLKHPNCSISIHTRVVDSRVCWIIYLHELIHCYSALYDPFFDKAGFGENAGYEEGVVELLQYYLRQRFLFFRFCFSPIEGWQVEEASAPHSISPVYRPYAEALEQIRIWAKRDDAVRFYCQILEIPIRKRRPYLIRRVKQAQGTNMPRVADELELCLRTLSRRA